MKNNNIIIKVLALSIMVLFTATSCSDWLDVKPKTENDAEEMFETPDGFKSALAGCYTTLTKAALYGQELTWGMNSVLAQEWKSGKSITTLNTSAYARLLAYNYEALTALPIIEKVWSEMYYAIAQVNTLLSYTEKNRSVLNNRQYAVIRGEAFALRAFIHADLFRLYGKVVESKSNKQKALPYVTSTKPGVTGQSTNDEYYEFLMKDIDQALDLLTDHDPIYSNGNIIEDEGGYYANRQFHMNYWAAVALKARMQLHFGKTTEALLTAKQVIAAQDDTRFRWITQDEVNTTPTNMKDRTFSTEVIFSMNIMELENYIKGAFRDTSDPLVSRLVTVGTLYPVGDFRGLLFETYNGMSEIFAKYWQMESVYVSGSRVRPKRDRMPIIRMTEMYFIAVETQLKSNPTEALRYLNDVRTHRGLIALEASILGTAGALEGDYLEEYQREFMGEGQLWYYHKRLNTTRIFRTDADYILPIPVLEWDLGDIEPIKDEK